jgi:hypothetical protein
MVKLEISLYHTRPLAPTRVFLSDVTSGSPSTSLLLSHHGIWGAAKSLAIMCLAPSADALVQSGTNQTVGEHPTHALNKQRRRMLQHFAYSRNMRFCIWLATRPQENPQDRCVTGLLHISTCVGIEWPKVTLSRLETRRRLSSSSISDW